MKKNKKKLDKIIEKVEDELMSEISAGVDAVNLYEKIAYNAENKQFKNLFLKIANQERKRIGTFRLILFK